MAKKIKLFVPDEFILRKDEGDVSQQVTPVDAKGILEAVYSDIESTGDFFLLKTLLNELFKIAVQCDCDDIIMDLAGKSTYEFACQLEDDIERNIVKMVPKIVKNYRRGW